MQLRATCPFESTGGTVQQFDLEELMGAMGFHKTDSLKLVNSWKEYHQCCASRSYLEV